LTVNVDNIIVGAGNLFISAPWDSYYGSFEGTSLANLMTNGSHMGATMDGVNVQYEPDYTDIEVDQLKDAAIIYANGFKVTVTTNVAEATLRNLQMAWGLPEASLEPAAGGKQKLDIPIPADDPVERKLVLYGKSPAATSTLIKYRKYFCRRAISVDASSHSLKRGEATMFPVSFRILADPSYSNAEYGYIEDET
jgi:hypothetical protein